MGLQVRRDAVMDAIDKPLGSIWAVSVCAGVGILGGALQVPQCRTVAWESSRQTAMNRYR